MKIHLTNVIDVDENIPDKNTTTVGRVSSPLSVSPWHGEESKQDDQES